MRVLIVENEIYLAQNISLKLADFGYSCDIVASVKDAIKDENYDVVLLSTGMAGQSFLPVVDKYKNSIVILMVAYINHDSVNAPLKAGAKDYIMKPFMIEELIKKINHYTTYERLLLENKSLRKLLAKTLGDIKPPESPKKNSWPLVLVSSSPKLCDAFIISFAAEKELSLYYETDINIKFDDQKSLLYFPSFSLLKQSEKDAFLLRLKTKYPVAVVSQTHIEGLCNIVIETTEKYFDQDEILTIEDYAQAILEKFQDKYTDIELAKRLGISRKSIWERRRKYGIAKKK